MKNDACRSLPLQQETETRLARLQTVADENNVSLEELKWANWMVVSRSLGVQGSAGTRQVLIPFLGENLE